MPRPLFCFQAKEMFLFWDNNYKRKKYSDKKCDQIIKSIYSHIYFIPYNRVDVEHVWRSCVKSVRFRKKKKKKTLCTNVFDVFRF